MSDNHRLTDEEIAEARRQVAERRATGGTVSGRVYVPDIIRGEDGRYIDLGDVLFDDDDDRAELIELFKRVFVTLGEDNGQWEITIGPDDSNGYVMIPLATLVRDAADNHTPGGSFADDASNWDELASLAAHLRALAAGIETAVANRDTSGHDRALARVKKP